MGPEYCTRHTYNASLEMDDNLRQLLYCSLYQDRAL